MVIELRIQPNDGGLSRNRPEPTILNVVIVDTLPRVGEHIELKGYGPTTVTRITHVFSTDTHTPPDIVVEVELSVRG